VILVVVLFLDSGLRATGGGGWSSTFKETPKPHKRKAKDAVGDRLENAQKIW